MNVLDENIRLDQILRLRRWRIQCRRLIEDLASAGIKDPNVLPLLHHAKHPTFFTHDQDYFQQRLAHPAYSLVWLDLYDGLAAEFIRRYLMHPRFKTTAQRMGTVARVHRNGVHFWERNRSGLQNLPW